MGKSNKMVNVHSKALFLFKKAQKYDFQKTDLKMSTISSLDWLQLQL